MFGSVARGQALASSDIDLMADFDPGASVSLVTIASLRSELSELLGVNADLVERGSLRPAVWETAARDAIKVL